MRPRSLVRGMIRAGRRLASALLLLASLGGTAHAQLPANLPPSPIFEAQPPAGQLVPAQFVPATPPLAVADKPAGAFAGGCPCPTNDGGTRFGVDLMLGQFTGIRGQAAVLQTDAGGAFVLEAFYGAILDRFGSGEGVGGGGRYYIRRTDRGGDNSLLIGPGLGLYYQSRDDVWMLAPTVDFAWVHAIGDNAAWELGLNAGLGVGLDDGRRWGYRRDDAGGVTPLFSVFTGFRF